MNKPFVSVILPIRNEAAHIRVSLQAVMRQDYPADRMEILVADGMSTDETRAIIQDLTLRFPKHDLKILDNSGRIVPTGMNIALRLARGEIIIRVDGHTVIAPDYVTQCVEVLQRTGADNAGGKMNAVGLGLFSTAVTIATSTPFGIGNSRFHYSNKEEWVDSVYMGAWDRKVFEKVGLFDEELVRNQDDEFNYRLRKHGGKILLSPTIKSEYFVRGNPLALWKQYFQYGYWKVRVLQKNPRQMSARQFAPPFLVIAMLISVLVFVSLFFFTPRSNLWLGLAGLTPAIYVFANLIAAGYAAYQHGIKYFFLVSLAFFLLHFSYGLGFIFGLFKFLGRWGDVTGKTPVLRNFFDAPSTSPDRL